MSISNRSKVLVATLFAFTGLAVAHCSAGGCLRFSDCAQGMTCGNGVCVIASPPSSNDEAGASLEAGSPLDGANAVVDGATVDANDTGVADSSSDGSAEDAGDASDAGDAGAQDASLDAADASG